MVSSTLCYIWIWIGLKEGQFGILEGRTYITTKIFLTLVKNNYFSAYRVHFPTACCLIATSAMIQLFEEPVYFLTSRDLRATPRSFSQVTVLRWFYLFKWNMIYNLINIINYWTCFSLDATYSSGSLLLYGKRKVWKFSLIGPGILWKIIFLILTSLTQIKFILFCSFSCQFYLCFRSLVNMGFYLTGRNS